MLYDANSSIIAHSHLLREIDANELVAGCSCKRLDKGGLSYSRRSFKKDRLGQLHGPDDSGEVQVGRWGGHTKAEAFRNRMSTGRDGEG